MSRDVIIQKFQQALQQTWSFCYKENQLLAQHKESKSVYKITPHIDGETWCWSTSKVNYHYRGFDFSTPHCIDGPSTEDGLTVCTFYLNGIQISKEDYWNNTDVIAFSKLNVLNISDKEKVIEILNV